MQNAEATKTQTHLNLRFQPKATVPKRPWNVAETPRIALSQVLMLIFDILVSHFRMVRWHEDQIALHLAAASRLREELALTRQALGVPDQAEAPAALPVNGAPTPSEAVGRDPPRGSPPDTAPLAPQAAAGAASGPLANGAPPRAALGGAADAAGPAGAVPLVQDGAEKQGSGATGEVGDDAVMTAKVCARVC